MFCSLDEGARYDINARTISRSINEQGELLLVTQALACGVRTAMLMVPRRQRCECNPQSVDEQKT
jgi:hypothetical protein